MVTFRILLLAIAFSTVKATLFALTNREKFLESFPGASEVVYGFFIAGAAVGFVALIGLFHYRRWGVWIFGCLSVVVTVVNFIVRAPSAHTLATIALAGLVLGLVYLLRRRFAASSSH
jgi:hypothetical protein